MVLDTRKYKYSIDKCFCGREFGNHRARNAHQVSHKDRPEIYSVSRKKDQTIFSCQCCGKDFEHSNATENKFCSVACCAEYRWKNISIPRILQGIGGDYKRYLRETRGDKCEECGQESMWNNRPLTLQLDHIDGNSDNNQLNNIRLLCPNCHTQTDTYGNKGEGSRYKKITKRNEYLRDYKASVV